MGGSLDALYQLALFRVRSAEPLTVQRIKQVLQRIPRLTLTDTYKGLEHLI
jgi:hypothetical protein